MSVAPSAPATGNKLMGVACDCTKVLIAVTVDWMVVPD